MTKRNLQHLLFISVIFANCKSVKEVHTSELYQINTHFFNKEMSEIPVTNYSYFLGKLDNYEIYLHPQILTILDSLNQVDRIDTFYKFYVFNKSSSYGFKNDSIAKIVDSKILKDSFETKLIYNFFSKTNYGNPNYSLLKIDTINNRKKVTYVSKRYINPSYKDTGIYYFDDELKRLPFSIDKKMDSAFDSKLVKYCYQYLTPPASDGTNKARTLEREICVSFEAVKNKKLELMVKEIMDRYKEKFE